MTDEITERLPHYLRTSVVAGVHKILPLYESDREGVVKYLNSFLFKVEGLKSLFKRDSEYVDYINFLAIILGLKEKIESGDITHKTLRTEVFNCITGVKRLARKVEEGFTNEKDG